MTGNKDATILSSISAKLAVFVWKKGPDGIDKRDPLWFDLLSEKKKQNVFYETVYKDTVKIT